MTHPADASFAEFAAIANYKPSYVTHLRKTDRLVLTEDRKRVRVAESLERIAATRDPAKAAVAERHAAARAAAVGQGTELEAAAAPAAAGDAGRDPEANTSMFQHWRERSEKAKALQLERENDLAEGKLLESAAVVSAVTSAGASLRTRLEALASELAPRIAALGAPEEKVRALLKVELELALTEASRQLAAIGHA